MRTTTKRSTKAAGILLLVFGLCKGAYRLKKAPAKKRGREARRARIASFAAAYEEAASDPAFMEEMREIDREFDVAVGDGLTPAVMA